MTIDQLASLFGWMTILNIGFLLLAWLFVWWGRAGTLRMGSFWRFSAANRRPFS